MTNRKEVEMTQYLITLPRAVIEQALEALEECQVSPECFDFGPAFSGAQERKAQAENSLRQALEQAQQQEPVAWNWMRDGSPCSPAYFGKPPDADIEKIAAVHGKTVRLLYAAPIQQAQQQEPVGVFRSDSECGHVDLLAHHGEPLRDGDMLFAAPVQKEKL